MKKEKLVELTEVSAKKKLRSNLGKHLSCPKCQRKKYVKRMKGKDKRYYCSKCRHKFSLKSLVGFKDSNLDFKQIYYLLYCFGNNKTHKDVIDWTGISYTSSRFNYSRIRATLKPHLSTERLAGKFICDECLSAKERTITNRLSSVVSVMTLTILGFRLFPIEDKIALKGSLIKTTNQPVSSSLMDCLAILISAGWVMVMIMRYMKRDNWRNQFQLREFGGYLRLFTEEVIIILTKKHFKNIWWNFSLNLSTEKNVIIPFI